MKSLSPLSLAAVSFALLASPAMAQEAEPDMWDGVYVSGTFGLGAQSNDTGETVVFDTDRNGVFGDTIRNVAGANAFSTGFCNGAATSAVAGDCRNDKDDFEYSVRIGADEQMGNLVVGFLVDAQRSESTDSVTAFSITPANYTFSRELDYGFGARGRVGYAAGGALFYATGGVNYGRIDNSFQTSNTANSFTASNDKHWSWGYSAGGGAEIMAMRNFTLGIEYLYTNYVDDKYRIAVGPGTAAATNPFLLVSGGTNFRRSDPEFEQHNLRLTASFRF